MQRKRTGGVARRRACWTVLGRGELGLGQARGLPSHSCRVAFGQFSYYRQPRAPGPRRRHDRKHSRRPAPALRLRRRCSAAGRTHLGRVLKNCCAAHLLRCGPPGVLTYCLVRSARQVPPRLASGLARDVFEHPAAAVGARDFWLRRTSAQLRPRSPVAVFPPDRAPMSISVSPPSARPAPGEAERLEDRRAVRS